MCVNMYGGMSLGLLVDYSSTPFFCSRICLVQNSLAQLGLLASFFRNLKSCAFGFWTPCLNCKCFSHGVSHLPSPEVPLKAHCNWGMMRVAEIALSREEPLIVYAIPVVSPKITCLQVTLYRLGRL